MEYLENRFSQGIRDSVPIGLGYLSVSFTFGMAAVSGGLPLGAAVIMSLTNLTSAGQFSALNKPVCLNWLCRSLLSICAML